jgi:flagellar hook-associated protein 3 FlgL
VATRIANLAQNYLMRTVIQNTQSRLADAQLQISTGQKSQDYAGIADESSRLVTLESSGRRIDQFLNDNSFVNLRLETMLNSIDKVKNTLNDVQGLLRDILEDGGLPNGVDKNEIIETKFSEVRDFLNVQINGRYLFAGSKTDTKPVVVNDLSVVPANSGAPNYTTTAEPSFYYQGDDIVQKARIADGVVINYGASAADPAFEKTIRAMRIIRSTDLSGGDPNYLAKIQDAMNIVNEADSSLRDLELNLGTKQQQVKRTNDQHTSVKTFFDTVITDLESADTYDAVARVNQDQTMLEASYKTVVRLSQLTLTNFL